LPEVFSCIFVFARYDGSQDLKMKFEYWGLEIVAKLTQAASFML